MFEIKKVILASALCCTVCFASDGEGTHTPPEGTTLAADTTPATVAKELEPSSPTNPTSDSDDLDRSAKRGPMSEKNQNGKPTQQETFDDFIKQGTAEGYYRAGLISNDENVVVDFDKKNIPMELYKIIDVYFKSKSQENKFDDYISFLKECPQYHYVKYRLGQVYEKTLQMKNAIEAYKEAGEYGEPELYTLGIKPETASE
tara:strand:- start:2590 stop:3195 length:606 start_codon:yes stop_codon:yes gene_type:complete